MTAGDDTARPSPPRRRREPLQAAPLPEWPEPEPEADSILEATPEAKDDAPRPPSSATRPRLVASVRRRAATVTAIALVAAAGAAVLVAAGGEGDPEPLRAIDTLEVGVRTETSAPRVEGASAAEPTPAMAMPPLTPGGELDTIATSDGVPATGGYTDLIRSYFGPLTVEAIVIVQCESNFDPLAVGNNTNGTQDHGLFQINDVHMTTFESVMGRPWTDVYDPTLNTGFAKWLHDHAGGWGPWRCNRNLEAFQTEPEPGGDPAVESTE